MPVMDGWEFIAKVAASEFSGMPIVVHSGDAKTPAGLEVFRKPSDFTAILEAVQRYCGPESGKMELDEVSTL